MSSHTRSTAIEDMEGVDEATVQYIPTLKDLSAGEVGGVSLQ